MKYNNLLNILAVSVLKMNCHVFFFMLFTFLLSAEFCEQCSQSYPFENYLGTRTPYRIVANNSLGMVQYEGCKQEKLWMIVRHGTRNPSSKHIELMSERLPKIRDLILESDTLPNDYVRNRDLDLFRKWKPKLDLRDENKLTDEGEEELLLMGERMQSRFPTVLNAAYSNASYKFKYTFSQRTKKSAYYFAAGLFGKQTAKDVWFPEPSEADPILRFYKLCKRWKNEIKDKVRASGEHKKFANSSELTELVKEVNERLGLEDDLDVGDMVIMYIACGFETAWNKRSKSPWCSPFTNENLKVFEYIEDLKYYWQDGYGHELTYKQACPAFGDMINMFESPEKYPQSTLYFSHSGTLLKILAHLGLYKDEIPLTHKNFRDMTNRKWRTSLIDSFATNLAFVLFDCRGSKKVLTLHQENIVRLPSCPDDDLCELETLTKYYNQSIDNCDFKTMCDIQDEGSDQSDSEST